MTFVDENLLKRFNLNRLKSYLKRLQAENGRLIVRYWCAGCGEIHLPKVLTERDKRTLAEIERIKRQKYLVKWLIAEKCAVLTPR